MVDEDAWSGFHHVRRRWVLSSLRKPGGIIHAQGERCEETMKRRKLFLEWSLHDFDGGGE